MMVVGTSLGVSVDDLYKYRINNFYLFSNCVVVASME